MSHLYSGDEIEELIRFLTINTSGLKYFWEQVKGCSLVIKPSVLCISNKIKKLLSLLICLKMKICKINWMVVVFSISNKVI